ALVKLAVEAYGVGAGASRLLSGGTTLHGELEEELAALKCTQRAVLFSSGYHANVGAIQALAGAGDAIFSDELNHASIIDGCRLSKAQKFIYVHNNPSHLEEVFQAASITSKTGIKLVVTESVFSMDGDIAQLDELQGLCKKYKAFLYVDDAHGSGVLGKYGEGGLAYFGIKPDNNIIQMGTLSKAFGALGAFIAGTAEIIEYLINTSRTLIYTTAMSVPDVAASLYAIRYIKEHDEILVALLQRALYCRKLLKSAGFDVPLIETPIVPVILNDIQKCLNVSAYLKEKGIYVPAIRPPTVKTPRLRVSLSCNHRMEDIEYLVNTLSDGFDRCQ
ncbi:MAG: aminotransferase class I/II-fold pyridoxal phosphate-dependent enzyme, partial [Candidatus Magnetoovum sp. WYHC-5]|nr:aminotransferase class I/II-fold pyridoxal phosphate-dependent enzyme [Candidatus Magnetoovum sp. WYHC-5]